MPASSPIKNRPIIIATRQSRLALWQAQHVKDLLEALGHPAQLLGFTTQGDKILDQSLSKLGGKGLFVKELESALEQGLADIAVHSLKDVPMHLPDGFVLASILERENPHDAWVSARYPSLQDLPQGAIIGTSSLRRAVLLRAVRPDVQIAPLRGNIDTRLRKLDEGLYDGIVLAAAGLVRLNMQERIRQLLDASVLLPAAGQGALAIEIHARRHDLLPVLQTLSHQPTWLCVAAERAVGHTLESTCSVPLAAYACQDGCSILLRATWGNENGQLIHAHKQALCTTLEHAVHLGTEVAQALLQQGAKPWNS